MTQYDGGKINYNGEYYANRGTPEACSALLNELGTGRQYTSTDLNTGCFWLNEACFARRYDMDDPEMAKLISELRSLYEDSRVHPKLRHTCMQILQKYGCLPGPSDTSASYPGTDSRGSSRGGQGGSWRSSVLVLVVLLSGVALAWQGFNGSNGTDSPPQEQIR